MPLNADAAYFVSKEKYEKAKTPAEKITALEEVISTAPTHKGAEKLRAQLKKKLAELKAAQIVAAKKKGGPASLYAIRKTGPAQVVLMGYPGSGKSSVLSALTNARPGISGTPYTTKIPQIGTLKFSEMDFQVVELPAVVPGTYSSGKAGELFGCARNAECIVLVIDSRRAPEQFSGLMGELRKAGLGGKRIFVIANKSDLAPSLHLESCPFPVLRAAASEGKGLSSLASLVWLSLGKIRVYTRKGDFTDKRPMVMNADSTVRDAVRMIHKDFLETFRFGRVWRKSSPHSGSRVGLDFSLRDEDVLEVFA
jgi:ribosome-interacting GTPase 1